MHYTIQCKEGVRAHLSAQRINNTRLIQNNVLSLRNQIKQIKIMNAEEYIENFRKDFYLEQSNLQDLLNGFAQHKLAKYIFEKDPKPAPARTNELRYNYSLVPSGMIEQKYTDGTWRPIPVFQEPVDPEGDMLRDGIDECQNMVKDEVKTSMGWCEKYNDLIFSSYAGWDEANFPYSFHDELISKEEFDRRVSASATIGTNRG